MTLSLCSSVSFKRYVELFTSMPVDASCILVLIQCRDREWNGNDEFKEAWAREAAQRCLRQGFAVLRVPTENWIDLKRRRPELFTRLFDQKQDKQHVICSINYIYCLCPLLQKVHNALITADGDNVHTVLEDEGFEIELPPGTTRISTDLYVVCEASSNIGVNVTPQTLRLIYGAYSEPVVWCGFNMKSQSTGSKAVIGDVHNLLVLGRCLDRLKLWHIDQSYKALRSPFFALCQRNHICFGALRHRSQCCDSSCGDSMPMSAQDYKPEPTFPGRVQHSAKERWDVHRALGAALQSTSKVRGPQVPTDVVCLRCFRFLPEDDPVLTLSIKRDLEILRSQLETQQNVRDCCKLQMLVEGDVTSRRPSLDKAFGVLRAEINCRQEQIEHEVMNWCHNKGWLRNEKKQWTVLAMVQRGLKVHESGDHLTCLHHKQQLHTFDNCVFHYTEKKCFHRDEAPSLEDLAANIENEHTDTVIGETAVLERFYGYLHFLEVFFNIVIANSCCKNSIMSQTPKWTQIG